MNKTNSAAPQATWRNLTIDDIEPLAQVANKIHPGLPERDEVFAERIKLFPAGCLALVDNKSNKLHGYAISHPIRYQAPPPLDSLLGEIAEDADQFYIHDLAILPECQGRGYGKECLEMLFEVAKKYQSTGLVSVYGTAPFWGRFGFVPVKMNVALQTKLVEYGEDAMFLERKNLDLPLCNSETAMRSGN
jgi:GNAT superfamily N-acetyltransferase